MGQLVTLIKDQLTLPLLAGLGFIEVLILMLVLVWLASRYHRSIICRVKQPDIRISALVLKTS
jgi:hypothetical protein